MEKRNLPWDLIEEILSRVPAASLARLRSTSKQWNSLLKNGSFANKHSTNAPKESLIVMLMDYRVYLVRINLHRILHGTQDNAAPSTKYGLYFKDPLFNSQVDIRKVFHCDGLLLCTTTDNRLVVWNPCSGETQWIKPTKSYNESDIFALGYDNRSPCKQYKIIRMETQHDIFPIYEEVDRREYEEDDREYEIYDFTSDSWRVGGVTNDWCLEPSKNDGMSMKGNTYWLYFSFLLSFDYSTERFQKLSLPRIYSYSCIHVALSVVREEQLFVLTTDWNSKETKVWVTTSTGSSMSWSWSEFLTLEASSKNDKFKVSFLVDEQNKFVLCCDKFTSLNQILHIVGEKQHIPVDHGGDSTCMSSCSLLLDYVPSLAQIQQSSLRKRKAPSTYDS